MCKPCSLVLKSFYTVNMQWKAWGGPKGGTETRAANNHVPVIYDL